MHVNNNKFDRYLPIVVALMLACNFVSFLPGLGNGFYVLCGIVFLYGMSKGGIRFNLMPLLFFCICIISIVVNEIPVLIRPWMRLGLFASVGFLIGNFVENSYVNHLRIQLYWTVQWIFLCVSLMSAVGKLAGLSLVKYNNFVGYTGHSNILGGVSAQALLFILFVIAHHSDCLKEKTRVLKWLWGAAFLCMLMLLAAASRTALISFLGGTFAFCYYAYREHRGKIVKVFLCVLVFLLITFPFWRSYTETIVMKNGGNVTSLNTNSRQDMWELSYEMFTRHPIIGVGFSHVEDSEYSGFTNQIGGFEIGNSYLAVMIMTGLLGFVPFMLNLLGIAFGVIRQYSTHYDKVLYAYLGGQLCFLLLHMMGEGYVTAGGNLFFFVFWLTIGCIQGYRRLGDVSCPLLPHKLRNIST